MSMLEVKDLLAQFDASSLRELSVKKADLEVYFSKNDHQPQVTPVSVDSPVVQSTPLPSPTPNPVTNPVLEPVEEVVNEVAGEVVTSPLVGIAYLAPAPDKPAFVSVGDRVAKGQTLLIIEAMKVMNEVPAPQDGVVTEILVADGDMVEFGKGLVRLA